ncbi:MAG: hypothetical protein JWM74_1087 [Myxococcaceae bacterium]|jgi:hypothetical protein|nr:hypothetical protein [Myxococcaceae bacterium]
MRSSVKLLVRIGRPLAALTLTIGLVSSMTGCKFLKKDEAPDAATTVVEPVDAGAPVEEAVADAGATPAAKTAWNPEAIPQPVDDEKMVSQITKTTYKAELDRVEKEVDGEK